ncbi:hypothetical protein [Burkholderia anthina]|uniref:hypothetical protein n=1 Tax=Burkholderia anthina TaxID=179879 RepID=UPI00158E6524|nr:hypothetical protein [Burkholderia anthina]
MKYHMAKCVLIAGALLPVVAVSQVNPQISLSGKTSSTIKATVASRDTFEVTDNQGGWFGDGQLKMQQAGARNSPYEVAAGLRVTSSSGTFQVRMDAPLQILNQANSSLVFQPPTVTLAGANGAPIPLAVGQSKPFTNPAPSTPNTDSIGYYTLKVSALPPAGDVKSTVGIYSGVLSLTFEPVVKGP